MTLDNHQNSRALQQDARAWAEFTGTKYTAALRQMKSPLAQGLLGERISARHLIAVLSNHRLVGAGDGDPVLGESGFSSQALWSFEGDADFVGLVLVAEMLRMFTPIAEPVRPEVSSYSLKHTAEHFLRPHHSYVSNGRLIWAAAALGLPLAEAEGAGPNILIGVSEREHDYVRRMAGPGQVRPLASHYRPAGYTYLLSVLQRSASGEAFEGRWERASASQDAGPFHDWLILQAGRDDSIGAFARDYSAAIRDSDHRIARDPDDLLRILNEVSGSPESREDAESVIAEWKRTSHPSVPGPGTIVPAVHVEEVSPRDTSGLQAAASIRTEQISSGLDDVAGFGAGPGTVERYEFWCPCGHGKVIEEHDNVPGFREHDVRIDCDRCRTEWRFVAGKSVRQWRLEPLMSGSAD